MPPSHSDGSRSVPDGGAEEETLPPGVGVNHVGHTVPDIDAAVEWYRDVLGFTVLAPPETISAGSGHFADLFADIIGDFESVRLAHLVAADGTGFELFEYESTDGPNAREPDGGGNWQARPGIHHFAVTHPNVDEIVERVEAREGEQHSAVWRVDPDQDLELVYVRDPWGNFVEVYNREYAEFFGNDE